MIIHVHKNELELVTELLKDRLANYKPPKINTDIKKVIRVTEASVIPPYLDMPPYEIDQEYLDDHYIIQTTTTKDELEEILNEVGIDKYNLGRSYCDIGMYIDLRSKIKTYRDEFVPQGKNWYPIYVTTYKRAFLLSKRYTIRLLEDMGIPYYIVIKQEDEIAYSTELEKHGYKHHNLLVVPTEWMDNEAKLGNGASIPQRNYALFHSIQNGDTHHWILDDNIRNFHRWNRFNRIKFNDPSVFAYTEEFARSIVEPIGLVGLNYTFDYPSIDFKPRYVVNTKVYSCILINNDIFTQHGIRWRLNYNEDVRLGLDCLTRGIRTIGMNQFLIEKTSTGTFKGGNQEAYKNFSKEGFSLKFSELFNEFGDTYIANHSNKYKDGRDHHKVKYEKFSSFRHITFY